jgi:hypothetical protein
MTNLPSTTDCLTSGMDIITYLTAVVAAHGKAVDCSLLDRNQIKIVRRMQAGLTAKPVAAVAAPVAAPRRAIRRVSRSLRCSCSMCRSGNESLCERD